MRARIEVEHVEVAERVEQLDTRPSVDARASRMRCARARVRPGTARVRSVGRSPRARRAMAREARRLVDVRWAVQRDQDVRAVGAEAIARRRSRSARGSACRSESIITLPTNTISLLGLRPRDAASRRRRATA